MKVMIVEDEPNIVESLTFVFGREGWQVAAALDGNTAIDRLLHEPPDILVLDVMLPPHSGFEVLKRIRSEPALRHLRSEEHTSELQSLMRISYAVFCLKKKTN